MKINNQQAREFLDRINPQDNVMIFTHSDMDGFASGILLLDHAKRKGAKVDARIVNYGLAKISDTDVSGANKIMLADLAPGMVWEDLQRLKDKEVFYTDHHQEEANCPIPENVLELRTTSQGYIPSTRTVYELIPEESEKKLWLVMAGVVADMAEKYPENKDFLAQAYKKLGMTHEDFFRYVRTFSFSLVGADALEDAFWKIASMRNLEDITSLEDYYAPVEKEFDRVRKDYSRRRELFGKIVYYHLETEYPHLKSELINTISGERDGEIYIFSANKGMNVMGISARNQSRKYDMRRLLQACTAGFEGAGAGGHPSASGAQIHLDDLERFKDNLRKFDIEGVKI